MKKWLSDKEIADLIRFANSCVAKSEYKGTFSGYDIAIEIMLANDGKSFNDHIKLVDKRIGKEYKKEQFDTHSSDWVFNQLVISSAWLRDKLLNDAVYLLKHLKRNNIWEKGQRNGTGKGKRKRTRKGKRTQWARNRNMKAKMKARKMKKEKTRLLILAPENAVKI